MSINIMLVMQYGILILVLWYTVSDKGAPTDGEYQRRHERGLGWDDITIKARLRRIVDTLSSCEESKFHPE